ncbi:MAG: hypothetical protein HF981_18085 [Desulfobacteraceae bacterium]|nr:hypothetical protein [Desulfobacteraceae bacterium]MBC2752307.1 hypothetical protein [Desulfobacteraceae bacterium]
MMPDPSDLPDFFDTNPIDPIQSATGGTKGTPVKPKKKAGFYLSLQVIERFDRKFHELKLAGAAIDNKSMLLEAALAFALDDLDRGEKSKVLRRL